MQTFGKLERVQNRLTEDLRKTTIPLQKLGEKYGVSRQAISYFCQRNKIRRPKRPGKDHTRECPICQALIRIAKRPHSDFISSQTIKNELRIGNLKPLYHLKILRRKGLISEKFAKLQSKKAEQAYRMYFTTNLSTTTIGRQVGLRNFSSTIRQHRLWGWKVPRKHYCRFKIRKRTGKVKGETSGQTTKPSLTISKN